MNNEERKQWHQEEKHILVEKDSKDWKLAEIYKSQHNPYSDTKIIIADVWRDTSNYLCIRYTTTFGRELDWFHYVVKNNELTWW